MEVELPAYTNKALVGWKEKKGGEGRGGKGRDKRCRPDPWDRDGPLASWSTPFSSLAQEHHS